MDHGKTWSEAVRLTDGGYDWPQIVSTLTGQVVVLWQDMVRSSINYRVSNNYGKTWGYVFQVPGLQTIDGRVALIADNAGSLHLAALNVETGISVQLMHLTFSEGQWSSLAPVELRGINLPDSLYSTDNGVALSIAGELGLVDAVGLGTQLEENKLTPKLWHTRRSIENKIPLQPEFAPEPTPTLPPTPTLIPSPTPRPTVDPNSPPPSAPIVALGPTSLPILAFGGIGFAFLLVASIVTWKVIQR
jgi:hypothetical protein